jgi:hypothetical protein
MSERLTDEQVAEGLRLAEEIDSDRYACTPEESDLAVLALALQERLQAAEAERDRWRKNYNDTLAALIDIERDLRERLTTAEAERDCGIANLIDEVNRIKAERDEARSIAEFQQRRAIALENQVDDLNRVRSDVESTARQQARREAFEEAAKEMCFYCRDGVQLTDQVTLFPAKLYHLKGAAPHREAAMCAAERIHLRAFAEVER